MKIANSLQDRLDADARARLAESRGQQFWRSLDAIADTEVFREFLHREFPKGAAEFLDPVSRRTFLKLMGASMALAGLTSCAVRQPQEQIAPFAQAPVEYMPGQVLYYASSLPFGGYATGVLVESHDGRPTKIEGNPNHPASLGATNIFAQAEILQLYDPERAQIVRRAGQISTWELFIVAAQTVLDIQRANGGAGLRILTETVTSPTLASQLQELQAALPEARWYQYDPVGRHNVYAGAQLAFGEEVEPVYRFEEAQVILTLDADFLAQGPGHVRYAREFSNGRRVRAEQPEMNRLYVVESTPSNTGLVADHRLRARSSEIEAIARYIAGELGVDTAQAAEIPDQEWLDAVVRDLQANQGRSLVLAGDGQPPVVHALVHAINDALGSAGATVEYIPPVVARPADPFAELRELVTEMEAGQVEALFIIGANPVYTAPADIDFGGGLANVNFSASLSLYNDETAALTTWHIPASHPLEAWGDLRAYDGTASVVQPLILPLYDSKSAHEMLSLLLGQVGTTGYESVRAYWQAQNVEGNFDLFWRGSLHNGVLADTGATPQAVTLQTGFAFQAPTSGEPAGLEIIFRPDPTIGDGRYANNGWLQELPKPLSNLTWDNAALMSPSTAVQVLGLAIADPDNLGVEDLESLQQANGQMVDLVYRERTLRMPVWILPGHADNAVTVHLGYGRQLVGEVGNGAGFNAYALRTAAAPWFDTGLEIRQTGERYQLVSTQDHSTMDGRDIVRVGVIEKFREDPAYIKKELYQEEYGKDDPNYAEESLLPEFEYTGNAWGMTIDLTACIGCNACTIACQAENNIPIVGKAEVAIGREMHWIRIDRYYAGDDLDNPATYVQPVTCMQCEKAPCELVCPVAATVHDNEGINNMVYNRCVGTKYCSNNCPYKVRRFNFFQYSDLEKLTLKLMRNPDVSVRNRGVMEKCTYCIQRISHARIQSQTDGNRPIRDGEILTACQQACPTQAIVFGDINDANSEVARLKAQPHNYTLLDELITLPRTSYLARLHNPNPELEAPTEHEGEA